MTNENTALEDQDHELDGPTPEEELDALKERAKLLGVRFSPKIKLETLRDKINAALAAEDEPEEAPKPQSKLEREAAIRTAARNEARKLVRLRITNMNPSQKDLHGEIFTFRNKLVGTIKKYIPYGEATDNGYHVPNAIYKQLKARKFLQVTSKMDGTGKMVVNQRWVPEFALEVMEPLSQEELDKLAREQAARAGL